MQTQPGKTPLFRTTIFRLDIRKNPFSEPSGIAQPRECWSPYQCRCSGAVGSWHAGMCQWHSGVGMEELFSSLHVARINAPLHSNQCPHRAGETLIQAWAGQRCNPRPEIPPVSAALLAQRVLTSAKKYPHSFPIHTSLPQHVRSEPSQPSPRKNNREGAPCCSSRAP